MDTTISKAIDKDLYKDIFENIPEGILICDSEFKIIDANKAFETLFGLKKEELTGKISSEFLKPISSCPVCSANKDSKFIPEQFSHQGEMKNSSGNYIPVRINHSKLEDKDYFILVISLLSDLACLNQAHVDFVSTVSHELRTPLTSIKGFADTLLSAGDKLDKEQQTRFISIIKSQIDRLTRLVENLLTVSRLEAKRDKSIYRAIDFNKFIAPILQGIQPKTQDHTIKVNILPNLAAIWADTDKLEQIMTNLVDNAVKYSYPNTTVTIEAAYSPDNSDFIEIKVMDQGIGIQKDHHPKIFTKFSRLDNPLTRQVQGTGLGLYITKSLVEAMGGKISVDSDENGTTFTLRLPVATYEKQAAQKFLDKGGNTA